MSWLQHGTTIQRIVYQVCHCTQNNDTFNIVPTPNCVRSMQINNVICVLRILNTSTLYNNTRLLGERLWLKRASFQRTECQRYFNDYSNISRTGIIFITFHSTVSLFDLPFPFPSFFYKFVFVFFNAPTLPPLLANRSYRQLHLL